jgi:hypothetical protein
VKRAATKGTGAKGRPDKKVSPAWTWRDQPPRLEHAGGFRVALYELGVRAGMALEHARVLLPAADVAELEGLLAAWLARHGGQESAA